MILSVEQESGSCALVKSRDLKWRIVWRNPLSDKNNTDRSMQPQIGLNETIEIVYARKNSLSKVFL